MRRVYILIVLLLMIFFEATSYSQSAKRVLVVIAPVNFRDEEFFETKKELTACGAKVDVASLTKGIARGMLGGTYNVDLSVNEVDVEDYDAVVFIGGVGARSLIESPTVINLAKQAYKDGKIIGAICIAPTILSRAGVLYGKKATIWASMAHEIKKGGGIYTGRSVEVDGRIVTANGPWAARNFGSAICKLLGYRL
ncbi:MAG: DJ-1/PfpI family protein [Thermosulfidibacteraceae bacterium]|jgi:protease I